MNYKEYSDSELCSLICENNEDAKNILYSKYQYIINFVIKKYLLSSLKVGIEYNDLYQEALVGFTDAINNYDDRKDAKITTFISICVERRLQNIIVKAKANKNIMFLESLSLDYQKDPEESPLKEVISDENRNDPLNKMAKNEDYLELLQLIEDNLSLKEFEVFTLLVSGLNYNEIAKNLEQTPKQVDNSIQRIKNKIKKIIEDRNK